MNLDSLKNLCKDLWQTSMICLNDFRFMIHNCYNIRVNSRDKLHVNIMLGMHSLEKGMSFAVKRKNWGRNKAYGLSSLIEKAYRLYGDDERLQIAMSVLDSYLKDDFSCKEEKLVEKIHALLKQHFTKSVVAGVKKIQFPDFTASAEQVLDFYRTRTSVRYFSNQKISDEELSKISELLSYTPTACNRQTCKAYAFSGDICKKIIDNQLGDQGWCLNADTVFVVVANGSYFNSTFESKSPYIDGGMFAMNLCMGLHMLKIGSCFKMFIRTPKIEREFKKICGLADNEIPIVLLLAGHYDLSQEYKQPVSTRIKCEIVKRS